MKFNLFRLSILSCIAAAINFKTVAAQPGTDSSNYKQAVANLANHFNGSIGQESRLYNGFIYPGYPPYIQGNAYLDDIDGFRTGVVDYDGQHYDNVSLLYDIYADQLIVQLPGKTQPLRLVSDKIADFDLLNRHFVRVANSGYGIKSGFYEQLYGGRSQVLNKLAKTQESNSNKTSGVEHYFKPVQDFHDYYIRKGGRYYGVDGLNSVLDLFKDKKKEIRKYIKDNNLSFNGLRELALAAIAAYYDRITI
jgi:hypothetical protein